MNDKTINKNLYKVFLIILKYTPIVLMLLFIIGFIFSILNISMFVITCIGGTSLITLGILYMLSYIFKFCYLFRLPLHYITITNTISIVNVIFELSLSTLFMFKLYLLFAGIVLVWYIYMVYKNRNKPKKDYIKDLCERYCECC